MWPGVACCGVVGKAARLGEFKISCKISRFLWSLALQLMALMGVRAATGGLSLLLILVCIGVATATEELAARGTKAVLSKMEREHNVEMKIMKEQMARMRQEHKEEMGRMDREHKEEMTRLDATMGAQLSQCRERLTASSEGLQREMRPPDLHRLISPQGPSGEDSGVGVTRLQPELKEAAGWGMTKRVNCMHKCIDSHAGRHESRTRAIIDTCKFLGLSPSTTKDSELKAEKVLDDVPQGKESTSSTQKRLKAAEEKSQSQLKAKVAKLEEEKQAAAKAADDKAAADGARASEKTAKISELKKALEAEKAKRKQTKEDNDKPSLDDKGPPKPAGSLTSQKECKANPEEGWAPKNQTWEARKWSSCRPVGFQGNTKKAEKYQVSHPACAPQTCKRKVCTGEESAAMLKAGAGGGGTATATIVMPYPAPSRDTPNGYPQGMGGTRLACAVSLVGKINCWQMEDIDGKCSNRVEKPTRGISQCGGTSHAKIYLWGDKGNSTDPKIVGSLNDLIPKDLSFRLVTMGSTSRDATYFVNKVGLAKIGAAQVDGMGFICGITLPDAGVRCFPPKLNIQLDGSTVTNCKGETCANTIDLNPPELKGKKFREIVAGSHYVCGIEMPSSTVMCWGHPKWATKSVWPSKEVTFKSLQPVGLAAVAGVMHVQQKFGNRDSHHPGKGMGGMGFMCGVTKLGKISCWGPGGETVGDMITQIPEGANRTLTFKSIGVQVLYGPLRDHFYSATQPHLNRGYSYRACGLSEEGQLQCWMHGCPKTKCGSKAEYTLMSGPPIENVLFDTFDMGLNIADSYTNGLWQRMAGVCGITKATATQAGGKLVCTFGASIVQRGNGDFTKAGAGYGFANGLFRSCGFSTEKEPTGEYKELKDLQGLPAAMNGQVTDLPLGRVICGLGETKKEKRENKAQCLDEIHASKEVYLAAAKKNSPSNHNKVWPVRKGDAEYFYDKVCNVVDQINSNVDEATQQPEKLIDVKMAYQANMGTAICVTTRAGKVKCYSSRNVGTMSGKDRKDKLPLFGPAMAPRRGEFIEQTSCKTSHVDAKGSPTGCTSCPEKMHHTILNPKRSTGTCTTNFCPFCKPSSCCGPHHKHFGENLLRP